jgi:hypothetical protein
MELELVCNSNRDTYKSKSREFYANNILSPKLNDTFFGLADYSIDYGTDYNI